MKTKRIAVNATPTKRDEIARWASAEGLSMSAYLIKLHNDNVKYAHENGIPIPEKTNFSPLD